MILQALYAYYQSLSMKESNQMPRGEYSSADVSFEVHLDDLGQVTAVIPYVDEKGKIQRRTYTVPKQNKRSSSGSKGKSYFVCDRAEYLFGSALSMSEEYREGMQSLWRSVLQHDISSSVEIRSLRAFLDQSVEQLKKQLLTVTDEPTRATLSKGGLCALKFAPTGRFLHEDRNIQQAWERYYRSLKGNDKNDNKQMCLVSGEMTPMNQIARLHPNIKNVIGAKSSGAAIVSFNKASFCSYGKTQSYNAPTSQKAADVYSNVLNKLLADPKHHVRMNDMTVVFWTDSSSDDEQELLYSLFQDHANHSESDESADAESIRTRLYHALDSIQQGRNFKDTFTDLKEDTKFYVLGLSPNAARLSVRFWYTSTLDEIGAKVWQHYKDLSVVGLERTPSIRQLLREIAVGHDWRNIPPNMEGQMLRSIILGLPYSRAVFAQLINRIRSESDNPKKSQYKIGSFRAAMIKAYLIRFARSNCNQIMEEDLTVALNEQSTSIPYHLGRLFACLEKAQLSALGQGINASIRDRFWSAASASPATVFPRLISLSRHHIAKDEKWGRYNDEQIEKVMCALPEYFPKRLSLEEQGMFSLGYYHQRVYFYKTNKN